MDGTSMLIGGQWRSATGTGKAEEVTSPYDGSVVGTVPVGGVPDVEAAFAAAEHGAAVWRRTAAHERMRILMRAADLVGQRAAAIANAGQVCISVQRVITHPAINADFLDALVPRVEAIRTGDPSSTDTTMGTLVSAEEARRSTPATSTSTGPRCGVPTSCRTAG